MCIRDSDWTIREITPSEGYLLDKTIHKVGADPKLYEVEHNLTSNDAVSYTHLDVYKRQHGKCVTHTPS